MSSHGSAGENLINNQGGDEDPPRSNPDIPNDEESLLIDLEDERPRDEPVLSDPVDTDDIEVPGADSFRYPLLANIMKTHVIKDYDGITNKHTDIDDWFEQMETVVEDHELSDKEYIFILKSKMKGKALTIMKGCSGSPYFTYKRILIEEFRGPNAKNRRLSMLETVKQNGGIVQFRDKLKEQVKKTEALMAEVDPLDYKIPEQMLVHWFIKGLSSTKVQELLNIEDFATLDDCAKKAVKFERNLPMHHQQQFGKRKFNSDYGKAPPAKRQKGHGIYQPPRYKPQQEGKAWNTGKGKPAGRSNVECFTCRKRGHIASECRSGPALNVICYKCNKEGHMKKDCRMPTKGKSNMNALGFTFTGETEEISNSHNLVYVFAKAQNQFFSTLIDSVASYNFISADLLKRIGVFEL